MSSHSEQDRDDAPAGFLSRWSRRKAQVRQGGVPAEPAARVPAEPAARVPAESVPAVRAAAPPAPLAQAADARRPAAAPAPEPAAPAAPPPAAAPAEPPPTMADVAALPRGAGVRRFVAPGVSPEVRNAALKNLFADPHFNIMDGLDIYIDDYGKPDPLPPGMLRQMAHSQMLGLFKDDEAQAPPEADAAGHPAAQAPAEPLTDTRPGTPPGPAPAPPTAVRAAPDEDPDLRLQPHHAAGPGRPAPGAGPDPGRQR